MKIITFDDIENLEIGARSCYHWVEEMLKLKSKALLPPKISLHPGGLDTFCNFMPSVITDESGRKWGGVKLVTRYPDRSPSLESNLQLFNAENGEILAFMDADWITTMRTGAVAAHSIVNFAKSGFDSLGFIGLGNTARATLLVIESILAGRHLKINLLEYKDQHDSFHRRFIDFDNLEWCFYSTPEEVVSHSDVIVSAVTYLEDDICEPEIFREGALLVPIHTRGYTGCDLVFDKIFGDDEGHLSHFKYFPHYRYFAETEDILNGVKEGRTSDEERIIVYNIGLSIHDVYFASKIYGLSDKEELSEIELKQPSSKFWI